MSGWDGGPDDTREDEREGWRDRDRSPQDGTGDRPWSSGNDRQESRQGPPPNQPPQASPGQSPQRQSQTRPPPRATSPRRRGGRGGRTPRSRRRRQQAASGVAPETVDGDPVRKAFGGKIDLYDIATWEVRSTLDSFAVKLTGALRKGRTALLVGAALALFLLQGAVAAVIVVEEPFIGVLAVSSMLPALAVAGYLWYGDPTRREPFVTLAATFLLSMLFAGFAGVINSTVGPAFEALGLAGIVVFYFVVVGPVEEFVKWLAVRVYAYRGEAFQTVVDGVVYGAAAGLGFAAIENLIYIVTVYLEAVDTAGIAPTEAATDVAAQRFFVGPGHVVYSAWAGFYLGLAKFNPENRGPIIVKGLLIAVFIHALYNTSVTVLPAVLPGLGVLGFIILYDGFWFVVLYRKVRAYRELYRARYPGGQRTPSAGGSGQQRRRRR
jgi:RsiW-degrading membrane proteinase PrsW (M82 family)